MKMKIFCTKEIADIVMALGYTIYSEEMDVSIEMTINDPVYSRESNSFIYPSSPDYEQAVKELYKNMQYKIIGVLKGKGIKLLCLYKVHKYYFNLSTIDEFFNIVKKVQNRRSEILVCIENDILSLYLSDEEK